MAVTNTIFGLRISFGLGSLLGRRWVRSPGQLRGALLTLRGLELICNWGPPVVFTGSMHQLDEVRIVIGVSLIAPVGLLMGMPFPADHDLAHPASRHPGRQPLQHASDGERRLT